jgi:hypothetical protein
MTVLEEAEKLVSGDRAGSYGDAKEQFERIATMWSQVLRTPVTAKQVCLCMIAMKIDRFSVTQAHRDSIVDIAGYARLLEVV